MKKFIYQLSVLFYKYICKIYQKIATIYEKVYLKKKSENTDFKRLGYFIYKTKENYKISDIKILQTESRNCLNIFTLDELEIRNLIKKIFDSKFRGYITKITGYEYSIDYFIYYERKHIPNEDRNVQTLKQAYSYRWHYDKPYSENMLKIIIPINILDCEEALSIIDKQKSKLVIKNNSLIDEKEILYFTSDNGKIYGFNPNTCWHRDGIPNIGKTSLQIMFQLNPSSFWSINHNIFKRNTTINKKVGIWTSEPKFPLFSYLLNSNDPIY